MNEVTLDDLWGALLESEWLEAAEDSLRSQEPFVSCDRDKLLTGLAASLRFRPQMVKSWPAEKAAKWLVKRISAFELEEHRVVLIRAWLLERHRSLLGSFLDALSISHQNGIITDKDFVLPNDEVLVAACRALVEERSRRHVAVYFGYLITYMDDFGDRLAAAVRAAGIDLHAALRDGHPTSVAVARKDEAKPALLPETLPAEPAKDAATIAERAEGFTTLDNLMTKIIVSSVAGEEGALDPDQIEDLVEELVALNSARHRLFFHRGFLHALQDKALTFHFPGENNDRRLWYATGALFGLIRRNDLGRCADLLAEYSDIAKGLASHTKLPCGAMLLPHVLPELVARGKFLLLHQWCTGQLERCVPEDVHFILHFLLTGAVALFRKGAMAEADDVLELLEVVVQLREDLPPHVSAPFRIECKRRKAQLLQARGAFPAAAELLNELVPQAEAGTAARCHADLGLIAGSFRSLRDVFPQGTQAADAKLLKALELGRANFDQAVQCDSSNAAKAHYCLGLLELLRSSGDARQAESHIGSALAVMLTDKWALADEQTVVWARFLHGLALLETLEERNLTRAEERLGHCLASPTRIPPALWQRALKAAAYFDDLSVAERICASLMESLGTDVFRIVGDAELHKQNKPLRTQYLEWLLRPELSIERRWKEVRSVLTGALKSGDPEAARTALDGLEGMISELPAMQAEYISLLNTPLQYSPAWDYEDTRWALVRLYQSGGHLKDAEQELVGLFHRIRTRGEEHEQVALAGILDALKWNSPGSSTLDELRRLLPVPDETRATATLYTDAPFALLYVGGNETQAQYEVWLRQRVRETYPMGTIQFLFPGWGSNWHKCAEEVQRQIPGLDAIVLSTLVRTQLGRSIRASCSRDCPWFSCTGRGRQSLWNSIDRAIRWVLTEKGSE